MLIATEKVFELMNTYGIQLKPFLFGIDFDVTKGFFMEPDKATEAGIYFSVNGTGNARPSEYKHDHMHSVPPDV